ncbi:MAG TPA: hypothetical protein VME19_08370 [Streptosporangiaceae bacterium]|nr:hypothetical protein [Streptosporangiaceae bacterium]
MWAPELAAELNYPGSPELLRHGRLARLAYAGLDGFPRVIVEGVPPEYLAAAAKSMDPAELQAFEANVRGTCKQMARIAVTPGWARFYDFGAGRVPAFLHELLTGG